MARFLAPTAIQVKEVLRRIPTPQLRRAFFEGLKNPLWVEPLAREGAFSNPPEPEKLEDGLIRDVYWPEIDYLIRTAPEAPGAVVDVLLKLGKSHNAWVRRGVFTVGSVIPADQAARLQPLIKTWAASGFGWRTDPRDLVGYAVNLLQGGQYEIGKWLASLLFKPTREAGGHNPDFGLEDYWYENGLPKVVAVLGNDGLAVVLPWLLAYERYKGRLRGELDITCMTRDSIRRRSNSHESVGQVLIDAVRDLAIRAMLADATEATVSLLKVKMALARKIALFALSEAIRQGVDDDERMNLMLRSAAELLFDESSLMDSCRIEYSELARSAASRTAEILEPLSGFIDTALNVDDGRLRQWLGRDDAEGPVVDERVRDYNERRLHRWLSAIGIDALPERLRARLVDLNKRFGVIESPLQPEETVSMWSGPNSPITQDEMSFMSSTELVAHLESWHDTGNGWGPEPSHEGQGRQLTALLTTNPTALAGVDDLVERLRPTYLRAILQGWAAALKADLHPDWHQVVEVTQGVLSHSDGSAFPVEGGSFDDDANFRLAKQAAVRLLEELVQRRSALKIAEEMMPRLADMLVTLAADDIAWSEYISHDDTESGMDPLTVSLNWLWPIRLRGLIYLMRGSKDATWYGAARSALERELSRDDIRGASRAVLGEGLGRLLDTDPQWLQLKISAWFGSEEGVATDQQIALTTAMAVHHYHSKLYKLLTPPMIGAINSTNPIVAGWRTQYDSLQRIGEWAINAIVLGHKDFRDPVVHTFFTTASAGVRGEAMAHIAWSFMHAESVDKSIRDRLAALWDARVEHVRSHPDDKGELKGFFWFVKSKKFDVEWWLPRLREALVLDPSLCSERFMIGKEIALSADVDPRCAFDVLKLLLERKDDVGMAMHDLTRYAVPMILARAIASGNDELKVDAEEYMNYLGAKGNLRLKVEVDEVLSGTITQDDVNG